MSRSARLRGREWRASGPISDDDSVVPSYPSLLVPPIGFAHRGASAQERDNTIPAFELALKLGATGLESDVWLTRDGVPVLDHDGVTSRLPVVGRSFRSVERDRLPEHVPSMSEFFDAVGFDFDLSLDIKDPEAAEAVVATVDSLPGAGDQRLRRRLWLVHPDLELLQRWRDRWPEVRLVNSVRLERISEGPERRAAVMAASGIDAVNLHYSEWNAGLTALFHRFGVLTFGWDAQHEWVLESLLDVGIDGLFSDYVDRMTGALAALES